MYTTIRPFGCHVTILNTIDHLGKFAGKSDEGFLVGYSLQSKAFGLYNLETKRVEENLHITFLENKPNVVGKGPTWLFDLGYLTDFMNYQPVRSENQANKHAGPQEANQNAGTEDIIDAGDSEKEDESAQDCFVLPIWSFYSSTINPDLKTGEKSVDKEEQVFLDELERLKRQEKDANDEAEALRKKFAQEIENLLIQALWLKRVTDQAKEIKNMKAQIKKLKKQAKPVITHHKVWMKSVSLKQRLAGKKSLKSNWMQKESVSKQGRKSAKAESSVHKDPLFDELDDDEIDNMDAEDAQDMRSTRSTKGTDDQLKEEGSQNYSIQLLLTMFGDDETIAQVLLNMSQAKAVSREKEKGVEFKDIKERRKLKEEDELKLNLRVFRKLEKKFKQLASDEEMARKLQEDWETEVERKRLAEEEVTNDALIRNYDDIKARIEADRLLAERLQEEEREQFTIEEREKFLHDTIAAQRRFLAQQRSEAIRNKPPT
ncbi:hypothetical protein Tco_1102882 [Tanacetum coccineum]